MKNPIKQIIFGLILITFGCSKSTESTNYQQYAVVKYDEDKALDQFAAQLQQHYLLPGVAMAKICGTSLDEIAIVGRNKVKGGLALSKDSKFQIGSCGKSFTALLAVTFVEEGLISWDTRIDEVFTEMSIHLDFRKVTLKQLLSHTAGLRHFWSDEAVYEIEDVIPELKGTTTEKRGIFAAWNLGQKPYYKTGAYQYSNGGYIIAAAMLEKISGRSYEKLLEERVFKPLKLESAEFGYPVDYDPAQPYRHIRRYTGGLGISLNASERIADPIFNPAGFISLTIEDFAQFVIFHIKALKGEETVINSDIVQELFNPVINTEAGNEVGMGWQIIFIDGIKTFGHTGSDGTIRSVMSIDPESWKAIVFATNIGDEQSEMALVNAVVELLRL